MPATDHATVHGSPGEGARMAGIARALWPLLAALFLSGYAVGATLGVGMSPQTAGVVLVLAGVVLLLGGITCRTRIAAFFKGAAGEEIVARELARLPAGFHVFHAVDAGGGVMMWRSGDIDHVVVGPTGIFVIETKNWRGQVTLADGRLLVAGEAPRRAPLEQVRQSVTALRAQLERQGVPAAAIVPVVCFAGDRFDGECQTVGEAVVCNALRLLDVVTDGSRRPAGPVDVDGTVRALGAARAG